MTQNVTLKLDRDLLRKAKVYAVQKRTSLSGLMTTALKTVVGGEEGFEKARRRALLRLKKGLKMGGGPYYTSRDELHQR